MHYYQKVETTRETAAWHLQAMQRITDVKNYLTIECDKYVTRGIL